MLTATRALLSLLVLTCVAGCGPKSPADALLERAVDALGGSAAVDAATSLHVAMKRVDASLPARAGEASVEYLLVPPDRLARRVDAAGWVRRSGLVGGDAWLRSGAAVADLAGEAAAAEIALRDDLLCLLVEPLRRGPFELTVEVRDDGAPALRVARTVGAVRILVLDEETGLPARVERLAADGSGEIEAAWAYSAFEEVSGPGSLRFPRRVEEIRGESTSTWEVTSVIAGGGEAGSRRLGFDRPDDAGPGTAGPITRRQLRSTDAVALEHTGPLTDLARVDRAIEHGLEVSRAGRRGPSVRVFDAPPGPDGVATVTTYVPVRLSRDPRAKNLPRGLEVRLIAAAEVLAMEYRGPYPRDASVYAPLEQRARELGLVPAGAPRHVILSDPEEGEPSELRQEIQLPVREGD